MISRSAKDRLRADRQVAGVVAVETNSAIEGDWQSVQVAARSGVMSDIPAGEIGVEPRLPVISFLERA